MAKFCWMPLYTSDLVSSCVDMTPQQFGAYVRLLCYAWDNGGVPNDASACGRIAGGIDASDWKVIRRRLEILDEGTEKERLSHGRLEIEREKQANLHDSRSEAGKRAAEKRWQTHSRRIANALAKPCHLEPEPELEPNTEIEPKDKKPAAPVPTSKPPSASGSRAKPKILWSADAGWSGITDADRKGWREAYPGAVLDQELAKASQWLQANPKRAGKRNWRKFLVGWMSRCQDRGGTIREPSRFSVPEQPDPSKRRFYRGDADARLTDAEYQAWLRDQRTGGTVSALASSLKLKEEVPQ
jgi:uncharacterized protein YdaU (DUF1376 family)